MQTFANRDEQWTENHNYRPRKKAFNIFGYSPWFSLSFNKVNGYPI